MTGIQQRNKEAKEYIEKKLNFVENLDDHSFLDIPDYQAIKDILENLIFVQTKGFRGIVATAITGKYLNPDYDPLKNFYGCNPRSLFEQGIFYAFENRIPCGKSDPLNVAKNANELNDSWALGKRPYKSAKAVVDFLTILESSPDKTREKIVDFFFFMLVKYSKSIKAFKLEYSEVNNDAYHIQENVSRLTQFTLSFPEYGAVPQLVIYKILYYLFENSNINVYGGDSSVFGTNTTSKKPADIWLEQDGRILNLYEVTVKKIDYKRLDDCVQSMHGHLTNDKRVNFICRLPEDVSTLSFKSKNVLNFKGITFCFFDLSEFIKISSCVLNSNQISKLLSNLHVFINDMGISMKTKQGWNSLFSLPV